MSLLPKSNDWCRRYSSKFNSRWDIPLLSVNQGKENLLLFPASEELHQSEGKARSRERLGGLLRFYHREAA